MSNFILLNANLHTFDPHLPHATALYIRDGKIIAVGTDDEIRAHTHPHTEIIDLGGKTLLPGLTDSHLHFEWYSLGLQHVQAETNSLAECLARVAERVKTTPTGQWIRGHGWNQTQWGGFPTAADLDNVAPEHPVFLSAKSAHAGWVNTLALRAAGITTGTPNPPGGEIQRNARGEATGILLEDAMDLVSHLIAAQTPEELAAAMLPAMENAWRAGLTGMHDFDGRRCFSAFQLLRERGQLGLRVTKMVRVAYLDHAIGLGLRSGFGDEWLKVGNVKVFLDGALGPQTASMIEAYENQPDNYGIVVTDKEALYEHATQAAKHGLAMTVHAIGDKANHELLEVYATVRDEESARGAARLRHRCEHVQILHPQDYARLGQLQVIASMQPIHATSDMLMADTFWGARRNAGAYAWRTQLNAGATLAFGSDAPIENFNPFWGIHAAVTRRRADGTPSPEGWFPDQRLTVDEAVRGFTLGAAYAGYRENETGALTPGKFADLIVIDRDIYSCDPMAIKDTVVEGTMVGGEWRWRNF